MEEEGICPDCNGKLRILPDETYCTVCGLVVEPGVETGIDWRGDEVDEHGLDSARAGKPGTFVDGDIYFTGMTEISLTDCIKCDKKKNENP